MGLSRVYFLVALCAIRVELGSHAWRQYQPWSTRQWCEQVVDPLWPYSYGKHKDDIDYEWKGRTASSYQNMGHECAIRGVRSKCHRCEPIECGADLASTCNYQLQGVEWANLPKNIPTISDTPFAVGPRVSHRNDFGNADRICVITSGGACSQGDGSDYTGCAVRCWGATSAAMPQPTRHGWTYDAGAGLPQGRVFTLAGNAAAGAGYLDGPASTARFRNPQGVAVDAHRNVYVSDTLNHAIRKIDAATGLVSTVAGTGRQGYRDGAASMAQFSHPVGIAVFVDCVHYGSGCQETLVVADSGNHRIRRVVLSTPVVTVETIAGGGNTTWDEMERQAHGLADGIGTFARFDTPMGVAVDASGNIFVADTRNHVIRWIDPGGAVTTLAGKVQPSLRELPGCAFPCLQGVPGYRDANVSESQFYSPYSVAVGPGSPYSLLVVDGDRLRLIGQSGQLPFWDSAEIGGTGFATGAVAADIQSLDTVYTLAGSLHDGMEDGHGHEAQLDKPRGVAMSSDGRVYVTDSLRCRIRSVTVGAQVARPLTCTQRLVDVVRPSGCSSYDPPTDAVDRMVSDVFSSTHYNYNTSDFDDVNGTASTADDATTAGDGYYPRTGIDGRRLPFCLGSPPPDRGNTSDRLTLGPYNGTGAVAFDVDEDTGHGATLLLYCPPGCAANVPTSLPSSPAALLAASVAYGGATGDYSDQSSICAAALHAGVIADAWGGHVVVTLRKQYGEDAGNMSINGKNIALAGTTGQNNVTSFPLPSAQRTFSMEAYPLPYQEMEVQTLAGAPSAPLDPSCGYADGQPPQAARFNGPAAVALYVNTSLTDSEVMVIADAHNHVIRAMTAVCSQTCENGGRCVGPERCQCTAGWSGPDCASPTCSVTCGPRQICTGPDSCTCVPGYSGPGCATPLCVQTCEHGGVCSAPDTCTCVPGWFDANCTTPVCTQTCGNGGNCTSPDHCRCPSMWQGSDCRTPVCTQTCLNGGNCTAPDTCTCPPSWSGHDCSKPVCHQGFFRPDPYPQGYAPSTWREPSWLQFEPCEYDDWCAATSEFECYQLQRHAPDSVLPPIRNYTGKANVSGSNITGGGGCIPIELGTSDKVPYRIEGETGNITSYARFTPVTPYGWGPTPTTNPWSAPSFAFPDRQVALGSYKRVDQGVYVCANGGNCTAPDTCVCAPGWIGFDCRIPVCTQGFYYPLAPDPRYPGQGSYYGSPRTLTIWENPATPNGKFEGYVHDHPNFHSLAFDMDVQLGFDETHTFQPGPGNSFPPEYTVFEGWRLFGWWIRNTDQRWKQGTFSSTYNRTCPAAPLSAAKEVDLRNMLSFRPVDDTFEAFHPRINYSDVRVDSAGRWYEAGGDCTDEVQLGCFNSGVCVAPNTCKCAPGWEGDDCTLPICSQTSGQVTNVTGTGIPSTLLRADGINVGDESGEPSLPGDTQVGWRKCPNNGNCSRPDTCTCEKGWTGADCSVPMCIQECFHDGFCSAPDTCTCSQYPTSFVDARGVPVFQKPDGDAQSTGWTGFDCNTPICTQADAWILNDDTGSRLISLLKDSSKPLANDGTVFEAGCAAGGDYIPVDTRVRVSETLCGQAAWYMGTYSESWSNEESTSRKALGRTVRINHPNYILDTSSSLSSSSSPGDSANGMVRWVQGPPVPGEGMYSCYNNGACTAPDICTCADGWTGYDCNVPICEYTDVYGGTVSGCLNGGVCYDVALCACPAQQSLLYLVHDQPTNVLTGWTGLDCSMATCTQGYYDADCSGVPPGRGGVSSIGDGCYRCANGGNCTAPDVCTCDVHWTGYDCATPVCVQHATRVTITDLNTIDPAVITAFEYDPCGSNVLEEVKGVILGRGNCSRPNTCTCLCRHRAYRDASGSLSDHPWQDPLGRSLPPGYIYGRFDCIDGYEGNLNADGTFSSCHLKIYVPTWLERYSHVILIVGVLSFIAAVIGYLWLRRKLKKRFLQLKAERRRERRMAEDADKQEKEAEKARGAKKRPKARRGSAFENV